MAEREFKDILTSRACQGVDCHLIENEIKNKVNMTQCSSWLILKALNQGLK